LAKINPYSKDLFKRKNITQKQGNAFDLIKQFKDKTFTKIFHDPPTFKFAPELYSDEFYLELNRVAKEHCRLFHYTGNPGSRFRNNNIVNTVSKKLVDAGWKIIRKSELGIYAIKD
jgi:predicted methyltransferase